MLLLKYGQTAAVISHLHRQQLLDHAHSLGSDGDVEMLDLELAATGAIEIDFPAFTDGRGFSQARFLRLNLQYRGVLRATGNLLPDQLAALFQSGFDEVLVGDVNLARHSQQDWINAGQRLAANQTSPTQSYIESSGTGRRPIWQLRSS